MRKVIFSKKASGKLEALLQHLKDEWSEKEKLAFIKKLDRSLDIINRYPESQEKSELKNGLHRCVVTKQTTIYYRFNASTIQVVAMFDTRMNPDRLKEETS